MQKIRPDFVFQEFAFMVMVNVIEDDCYSVVCTYKTVINLTLCKICFTLGLFASLFYF